VNPNPPLHTFLVTPRGGAYAEITVRADTVQVQNGAIVFLHGSGQPPLMILPLDTVLMVERVP
jgi:hypothetical protein